MFTSFADLFNESLVLSSVELLFSRATTDSSLFEDILRQKRETFQKSFIQTNGETLVINAREIRHKLTLNSRDIHHIQSQHKTRPSLSIPANHSSQLFLSFHSGLNARQLSHYLTKRWHNCRLI